MLCVPEIAGQMILVGEALMRSEDPDSLIEEFHSYNKIDFATKSKPDAYHSYCTGTFSQQKN